MVKFTSGSLYPHHIQRVQALRAVVPDLQHISAVARCNSIGFSNTLPLLTRANSRKTGKPTAPTHICEYGPQELWPLHCKQPRASSLDKHAMWSYRQPTYWDIPPAGTFNSWPLPVVMTRISLLFIPRGRSQLCLMGTPDVTTAMPSQHVFQHVRQL